jgi:hypothetical protein
MERRDADQYPTGILEVPPPPELVFDSPPSYGDFAGEISQAMPSNSTPHTLLGVVKTRQFGAALIQTHGSAYSVRVGDSLRQSSLKLTALDQDRAILSNGQRTFVVNVGEQF